jgi:hypothetical protein
VEDVIYSNCVSRSATLTRKKRLARLVGFDPFPAKRGLGRYKSCMGLMKRRANKLDGGAGVWVGGRVMATGVH